MLFQTIRFSGRERSTSTSSQRSNDSDQTAEYRRELRHQRLRAQTAKAELDQFETQQKLEQLKNPPPQIKPKRSLTSILSTDSNETKETKTAIRKLRLKDALYALKQAVASKLNSTDEQDTAREVRKATKELTIAKQNAAAKADALASQRLIDANDELAGTLRADEKSKQAKHLSETAQSTLTQARAEQDQFRENSTSNLRTETAMAEQKTETAKHLAEAAQQKLNTIRTTADTDFITANKDSLTRIGKQSLENKKILLEEAEKDIRQGREGRRQAWADESRSFV